MDLFLSPVYRCAYVYRYFVSHACILEQLLIEAYFGDSIVRGIFDFCLFKNDMRLCAIGGGPGTDVVGFMNFLNDIFSSGFSVNRQRGGQLMNRENVHTCQQHSQPCSCRPDFREEIGNLSRCVQPNSLSSPSTVINVHPMRIFATVLDNCPQWIYTASMIFKGYDSTFSGNVCRVSHLNYQYADFSDPNFVFQYLPEVQNADLVTMVKVVSAMAGSGQRRQVAMMSVQNILWKVKPGAIVFFMDNAGGGYTDLVDRAALSCGMQVLYRAEHRECMVPSHENSAYLQYHLSLFRQGPQSRACVTAVLWWKPINAHLTTPTHLMRNTYIS